MPDLLEAIENGVAWLTLNRPERLERAVRRDDPGLRPTRWNWLATDREVGCIVITGAGRGWCSGGDVKSMEAARPRPECRGPGRGAAPLAPIALVDAQLPEADHRGDQRAGGRRGIGRGAGLRSAHRR